jgi:hypothetical protein
MNRIKEFFAALRRFFRLTCEAIIMRESDCLRRAVMAHDEAADTLIKAIRGERTRGVAGEEYPRRTRHPHRRRIGDAIGAD